MESTQEFSFKLEESERVARKFLESYEDRVTDHGWKAVTSHWRKIKKPIITALNPHTGRKVIPIDLSLSITDKYSKLKNLLITAGANWVANYIDSIDVESNSIQENSLFLAHYNTVVKKGQKLSRALVAAYQHDTKASADEASALIGSVTDRWKAGITGKLVLSANILDILTVSSNASFTSCHSPDGCHRAGPQQYLADDNTVVAYLYREFRLNKSSGVQLPYKVWRQMIHLDMTAKSAAFMRHYGTYIQDETHKKLRHMVAVVLASVAGQEPPAEPDWKLKRWLDEENEDGSNNYSPFGDKGVDLAFIDPCTATLRLGENKPKVKLASSITCTICGEDTDEWTTEFLSCDNCENGLTCAICGGNMDEDDSYTLPNDDCICTGCYEENYTDCESCGATINNEDITSVDDHGDYCERCLERLFTKCEVCEEWIIDKDIKTGPDDNRYCECCFNDVFSPCEDCDTDTKKEELGKHCDHKVCLNCSENYEVCPTCGEEYNAKNDEHTCETECVTIQELSHS